MKKQLLIALALVLGAFSAKAFTLDTLKVATTHLETPGDIIVVTPDAAKANPAMHFPTVYILHGYDGNYRTWLDITSPDLPRLADEYNMIFVFPDGRDSWYFDAPADPNLQMESYFTKDLVPFVDKHYPTLATPNQRAITGLSMGGHGALWLALRHPDIWGNAGSMSGGVDIRPFPKSWKLPQRLGDKESNPQVWEDHTVINLVPRAKDAGVNITFDCGSDDFFYDVNNNLHRALLEAGVPHDYTSRPGNHSHKYWRNSILYHLLFFSRNFNKD